MSDFFRFNLPYGIAKNKKGEWMAFNREYMPLGFNNLKYSIGNFPENEFKDLPIYTKFKGITEELLMKIADYDGGIKRNSEGQIIQIWLYNDGTNPMNNLESDNSNWNIYWKKLELLCKLIAS